MSIKHVPTMRISIPSYQTVAYIAFLVMFPGYVIYHYGIRAGWFPAFAGGLFGIAALVVSLFGLMYVISNLLSRGETVPLLECIFLILLTYMSVWTLVAADVIAAHEYAMPALIESLSTIVIWVAVYFIGVNIRLPMYGPGWVLVLLVIAVIACFVHAIYTQNSFLGPYLVFSGNLADVAHGSTYQGIGRAVVVVAVVLASIQRSLFVQLAVLAGAIIVLLLLESRAHLFLTGLLLLTHLVLFGFRGRNFFTGMTASATILMAAYFSISIFLQTRAAEILNLSQSTSWQVRQDAFQEALRVIYANPLFGSFGYHLGNSIGYAHNIISAWTEYGIAGFLLFIVLILYALGVSGYRVLFRHNCPPIWIIAFQFNLAALFLALTSEPIFASVFPALGWGFTVQARKADRSRRAIMPSPNGQHTYVPYISTK